MEFFWSQIVAHSWAILLGGAGGYAYYKFVGCKTGFCPITDNPWVSTLYGAVMGAMLAS
ncbi:MAG: DUF6132 family protein [Bacteroidota bacterium]